MPQIKDYNDVLKEAAENYAERIDMTSTPDIIYEGFAKLDALTSENKWQIKRTNTSTLVSEYADGDDNFNNVWDDRVSLSYS